MIESLRIENLGVIEEATLELGEGMTALSGETGAGKTMALTSLQLILGAKADPAIVRGGAEYARVEGSFVVAADSPILSRIDDAGASYDLENGAAVILVARHVPARGRSSAYIGGRRVPTSVLTAISGDLVTVHGQSDQIRLVTPSQQRAALDEYGGSAIATARAEWNEAYAAHREAAARIEAYDATIKDRARERLAYQALVAAVESVGPREGEDEALKAEAHLLETSEERYELLSAAAAHLSGSDATDSCAIAEVDATLRMLEEIESAGQLEESDEPSLASRLRSVRTELADISATVAMDAAHVESDPERLAQIYARRQQLAGLRKELGMGLDEALIAAEEARTALEDLGDPEAARLRLERELEAAQSRMDAAAAELHARRSEAAGELSSAVEAELRDLALANASFEVLVEVAEPGPSGADSVRFLLAPHRGATLEPISTSASGGELSRVMLAVEVCLAAKYSHGDVTFLFDEVDAGIGGRAAHAVGQRLARLATTHQVVVVTHLAQVAAYAGTHLLVSKEESAMTTRTEVGFVAGDERIDELARMLSGNSTVTARAHAAELLLSSVVGR